MLPAEMAGVTFAFGHAFGKGLGGSAPALLLARLLAQAARTSDCLEASQLIGLLHSCARWRLVVPPRDLACLASSLGSRSEGMQPALAGRALHSLVRMLQPGADDCAGRTRAEGSGGGGGAGQGGGVQSVFAGVGAEGGALPAPHVGGEALSTTWAAAAALDAAVRRALAWDTPPRALGLAQAVEAAFIFGRAEQTSLAATSKVGEGSTVRVGSGCPPPPPLPEALAECLARPPRVEAGEAARLHQRLQVLGGGPDDPVMQVLAEHAKLVPS
mmetsp:Transcript_106488/g.333934  ORF Transcript_106488/g.333934 Transcript_106488/m.333934 type:complete len:272 (+) Transcript_106488:29-844(+)